MSATTCRIPGCDGYAHADDLCETELDSMPVVVGDLIITVNASDDQPVELVVWNDSGDLLRTTSPAEAAVFAERIRGFAAAVDKGAALLAPPVKPEPVDYAARFAALDSDVLFDVEEKEGDDPDAAARYVESLLIVLTEWRTRVMGLLAETPAEWAVPEVGAYQRALNRTREAWLQYGFRWQGGPALPWPFDVPEPVEEPAPVAPVARITSAGRRSLIVREVAA